MKNFDMGIHSDIDINDYHNSEGISNSGLSLIRKSPAKYYYKYLSGLPKKENTKPQLLGSAVHMLTLEPKLFSNHFYILPENIDRRTKHGKEIYNKAFDITKNENRILKVEEFEQISLMSMSIRKNKAFKALFETKASGKIEHSLFWRHPSGIILKSRPDWFSDDLIIDIKTTDSAEENDFSRSIAHYGYHRQAYLSTLGLFETTKRIYRNVLNVAVESEPPHLSAAYLLDYTSIEKGRDEVEEAIEIYHRCLEFNEWPGYDEKIKPISLPLWYK